METIMEAKLEPTGNPNEYRYNGYEETEDGLCWYDAREYVESMIGVLELRGGTALHIVEEVNIINKPENAVAVAKSDGIPFKLYWVEDVRDMKAQFERLSERWSNLSDIERLFKFREFYDGVDEVNKYDPDILLDAVNQAECEMYYLYEMLIRGKCRESVYMAAETQYEAAMRICGFGCMK